MSRPRIPVVTDRASIPDPSHADNPIETHAARLKKNPAHPFSRMSRIVKYCAHASGQPFVDVDEGRDRVWLDVENRAMNQTDFGRRGLALGLSTMLISGLAATLAAQEPKPAAPPPPTVAHRVPSHFGQVDLTSDQRAKIYAIQDAQQPAIDRLKQQFEAARAKMLADTEAVLTASQRERLTALRAAAKAKSLARSQARAKAKEASQAPVAKKAG